MSDLVFNLDRAITSNPDAKRCPNNEKHGKMFPHASGAVLICAMGKKGDLTPCHIENISAGELLGQ